MRRMPGEPPQAKYLLKKMRLGELERELQGDVLAVAGELNYERTITAESNLSFLWELYNAEREKKRRSSARLKKAEALIMKLATLQHDRIQREIREERQPPAEKRPFAAAAYTSQVLIFISKKLKELFESIGLKDEKVMVKAVESIGEKEIEERVELVLASRLGEDTVKAIFGAAPRLLLEQDFSLEIETLEQKKDVLDWKRQEGTLPAELDYLNKPDILLKSYAELAGALKLKPPGIEKARPVEKPPAAKYRGKPMHPRDFVKVIKEFGFELVREAKHGQLYENMTTKKMMGVQRAHISQVMLNGSTIKKKLTDAGVEPDEFEAMRVRLKL